MELLLSEEEHLDTENKHTPSIITHVHTQREGGAGLCSGQGSVFR